MIRFLDKSKSAYNFQGFPKRELWRYMDLPSHTLLLLFVCISSLLFASLASALCCNDEAF